MPKHREDRKKPHKRKKAPRKGLSQLSEERLRKMSGREQRKGEAGEAANYITRTQAVKRLQVSLRDFRRLCILKGIYPRKPKKVSGDRAQTYYHIKDIQYLLYEPLLNKFRDLKAFMRRVKNLVGKGDLGEARRRYAERPVYTLDHLIKERYPRFADALSDLDDAVSMVHLFAQLPVGEPVEPERVAEAARIARQWQLWVVRSRSLRKVFLSVKGVYYQAESQGIPITWCVPYPFTLQRPRDVDFKVMLTFLELHATMLKFTMFKLYGDMGLKYPPRINEAADGDGAWLSAMVTEKAAQDGEEEEGDDEDGGSRSKRRRVDESGKVPVDEEAQAVVDGAVAGLKSRGAGAGAGAEGVDASAEAAAVEAAEAAEDEEEELDDVFGKGDDADSKARASARALRRFQKMFSACVFFLNREVMREAFEFMILSFGGQVGWDGPSSPFTVDDPRITHHVVDRPLRPDALRQGRDYVQPQWVCDSINARMLLPIKRYAPGAELPPHLSPFVDDYAEGYIPEYRTELDQLRSAAAAAAGEGEAATGGAGEDGERASGEDSDSDSGADDDEDDEDGDEEDDEDAYARRIALEKAGVGQEDLEAGVGQEDLEAGSDGSDDDDEDEDEDEDDAEAEAVLAQEKAAREAAAARKKGKKAAKKSREETAAEEKLEMQMMMMSNRKRRLYHEAKAPEEERKETAAKMLAKREAIKAKKGKAGKGKGKGKGEGAAEGKGTGAAAGGAAKGKGKGKKRRRGE